ncbi:synaptonemal complex central element protein 1-like isoform X2 [Tupaia chinensis]|uniref:synaptonemal complex central element protein 1-like isoform X2 n=1 Tax=Tupaia chinensis TaxID=246437 RepID=UPI0003C8EF95|nr:synaptonemal complex central element protein 1-like isoform X2 [Tupaia chinensis]
MAGMLEHPNVESPSPKSMEEAEQAEGQVKSSKKTEDLLEMVKKLQKEGSLEPQIEDLINRINELQQAKKKSSEELGEAHAVWEALHRELDSLNGEKVHLEEVLSKKQEALRILQLHCQERESGARREHMLQECVEQMSVHNSQIAENHRQWEWGSDVREELEEPTGLDTDLWEFYMLRQRLAREIRALESSREQLRAEKKLLRAQLRQVEERLRSQPGVQGAPVGNGGRRSRRNSGGRASSKTTAPQSPGRAKGRALRAPPRPRRGGPAAAGEAGPDATLSQWDPFCPRPSSRPAKK